MDADVDKTQDPITIPPVPNVKIWVFDTVV